MKIPRKIDFINSINSGGSHLVVDGWVDEAVVTTDCEEIRVSGMPVMDQVRFEFVMRRAVNIDRSVSSDASELLRRAQEDVARSVKDELYGGIHVELHKLRYDIMAGKDRGHVVNKINELCEAIRA